MDSSRTRASAHFLQVTGFLRNIQSGTHRRRLCSHAVPGTSTRDDHATIPRTETTSLGHQWLTVLHALQARAPSQRRAPHPLIIKHLPPRDSTLAIQSSSSHLLPLLAGQHHSQPHTQLCLNLIWSWLLRAPLAYAGCRYCACCKASTASSARSSRGTTPWSADRSDSGRRSQARTSSRHMQLPGRACRFSSRRGFPGARIASRREAHRVSWTERERGQAGRSGRGTGRHRGCEDDVRRQAHRAHHDLQVRCAARLSARLPPPPHIPPVRLCCHEQSRSAAWHHRRSSLR